MGTSSTISRQNLKKVCNHQLTISLGRQRAASASSSPACLDAGQSIKPLLPSNHTIKQAHKQAHFQPNPLYVACSCQGPDFDSTYSACSLSVLLVSMSVQLLSETLSPILTFYSKFYLSQLDCSKNFTSCPHNFCCPGTQLFWWQPATTLIAQQIVSVRVPFLASPTQETTGLFFGKEKQKLDNLHLLKFYMCRKSTW